MSTPNAAPRTLVIFGATGDLMQRKLAPALYRLQRKGRLPEGIRIVGVAPRDLTTDAFRATVEESLRAHATWTWVQGCDIQTWERPDRTSAKTRLTVDHVMASGALPLLFPAVRLGGAWHADGGIRLAAPFAPAVHLGASRIIAVSTRHRGAQPAANRVALRYPPPAQVLGKLFDAVFLDVIDQDARRLDMINGLICDLPPEHRRGMRKIESLVVRPSVDLGKLARQYEPDLPRAFRFMTRGLGTREISSPDFLSLLMFQPDYIAHMIEIGAADARRHYDEISRLLMG